MGRKANAVVLDKLEIRRNALIANSAELPQMDIPRQKVEAVLTEMKALTAQHASLTAAKQDITKRLAELNTDGRNLLSFVDAGIRQHYGSRAEKLVEFDQQPFRSQPRVRVVGPDGKPVKPGSIPAEPAAHAPAPSEHQ